MPNPNDFKTLIDKLRKGLAKQEARAIADMIATYRGIYRNVKANIDAFGLEAASVANLTTSNVVKLEQYKALIEASQEQLGKYGVYVETKLSAETYAAIKQGAFDAKTMTIYAANGSRAVQSAFRTLNPRVIESLTAFLQKDGPLYKNIAYFAKGHTDQIRDLIINDVALGKNPRVIAKEIVSAGFGRPLADAIRTMRTAQLWSYREANILSYKANENIVRGWVWNSVLDSETCGACWSLHGSVHTNDEMLDDHYNGHCYATPLLVWDGDPEDTGQARFNALSDKEKLAILGPGKYDAYKSGRFTFDQLAMQHDDDVYGQMHVEATLQELVNEAGN